MSYLQAFGHPPALATAPADTDICAWTEVTGCEALHNQQSSFNRLRATGPHDTLHGHRPNAYRCINPTGARCMKRRVTANRKERRRTLSINNAFAELRGCIPSVPADTKLSKIKTLRLASTYINYLSEVLAQGEAKSPASFKAEVVTKNEQPTTAANITETSKITKTSGRTGWPQEVWALELKRENPS